jgi:hypothetical protein
MREPVIAASTRTRWPDARSPVIFDTDNTVLPVPGSPSNTDGSPSRPVRPFAKNSMVPPPLGYGDTGTKRGAVRQPRLQLAVKRSSSHRFGNRVAIVNGHHKPPAELRGTRASHIRCGSMACPGEASAVSNPFADRFRDGRDPDERALLSS